jgi:hypothetical protein
MPVRPPALMYSDMKLNIALFCALLWALFGNECNNYREVMKVLQVLDSWGRYATWSAYTPEICRHILWAVLHEEQQFINKKLLSTAFMPEKTVLYPMCLLNILDEVLNAETIAHPMYPSAWPTDAKQSRQIPPREVPSIPPPTSWPAQPSASGGLLAPAGRQTSRQQQPQSVDKHHPWIKINSLMDPYLAVQNNRVNINKILAAANKCYKDLPTITKYMTPQGGSAIFWNSVLGQCTFGWNCVFCCGHVKPDKISQELADGVCNVIAKGILHLCKNNGGTVPLPAANKKCITSKQATANK